MVLSPLFSPLVVKTVCESLMGVVFSRENKTKCSNEAIFAKTIVLDVFILLITPVSQR